MRILVISGLYDPYLKGGAEVMAATLARGMVQRGHFVGVATTHDGEGLQSESRDGVEIRRYGIKNSYWHYKHEKASPLKRMLWHSRDTFNLSAATDIKDAVESFQPDVAVCHNLTGFSISTWQALADCGVPIVQVLHDYYTLCPRSTLFKNGNNCETRCVSCRIYRLRHPNASRLVAGVIGVSRAMLEIHEKHGMFASVPIKRVIYNARMMNVPERSSRVAKGVVFGFIGALTPEKGIRPLLEAFQLVSKRHPSVKLLVAGEGEPAFVAKLKQLAAGFPVEFVGRVNASDFYVRVDVCVVPSVWDDPLPGVVFEALGHGVPVVGSGRGGIPEMVRHGENGLTYNATGERELELALEQIVSTHDLLGRLATAARPSAAIFTDVDRMLHDHEMTYYEVIRRAGSGL